MYIYIYTYIYVFTHTHINMFICMYAFVYVFFFWQHLRVSNLAILFVLETTQWRPNLDLLLTAIRQISTALMGLPVLVNNYIYMYSIDTRILLYMYTRMLLYIYLCILVHFMFV